MNGLGAGEGYPSAPSAREKIEMLLADEGITASLSEIVGLFTFKQVTDPEKWLPTEVVLRQGYDSDSSVVLVVLRDLVNAAITSNADEDYLKNLFRLTGLKPEQARLRFDINAGFITKLEP